METIPKQQMAGSLLAGAIVSLSIFIGGLENFSLNKLLIVGILIVLILISLKVILDKSTDLHFIGNPLKFLLGIKRQ